MTDGMLRLARDTFYVSVGFGVLAFQKAQVRRRELEKQLGPVLDATVGRLVGNRPADDDNR